MRCRFLVLSSLMVVGSIAAQPANAMLLGDDPDFANLSRMFSTYQQNDRTDGGGGTFFGGFGVGVSLNGEGPISLTPMVEESAVIVVTLPETGASVAPPPISFASSDLLLTSGFLAFTEFAVPNDVAPTIGVAAIPEPTPLALAGLGIVAGLFARRRARRA